MNQKKNLLNLLADLKRLESEIEELGKRRQKVAQMLGELNCPYKIGDRMKDRRGIIWEITVIGPGFYETDYRMKGRRVVKGGGLGVREQRLWMTLEKVVKP